MSKENNLTDFLTDVADAIREKKGTSDKINPQNFSDEIKGIKTSTSMWTGHVDVEGLKAIGWDDEDIAYYQEHGVNWMEEDDEYYKVSDDNKALYGVLTADNIQEYKDRIVWLPKIELKANMADKCREIKRLKGIPILDCSKVWAINFMFYGCISLTCAYLKNTTNITQANSAFRNNSSLMHVHPMDLSSITTCGYMFYLDIALEEGISLNLSAAGNTGDIYTYCYNMKRCGDINESAKKPSLKFYNCYLLTDVNINNLGSNQNLSQSLNFSKSSLLYMIEHEAATSAITITLHASAYARLAEDPDIVAALAEHPLVSLASA